MRTVRNKLFCIMLAALLLLTAACGAGETAAAPTPEAPSQTPAGNAATPEPTPPAAEQKPDEDAASVPAEKNGDVVILFTSDVHCGVDQGFGYAGLQQIREYLLSEGNEVVLVDDGDSVQGEPLGTMTRGEAIIDLMNQIGYDLAIPGNHDFDYGMEQFFALTKKAEFPYLSCNFNYEGELQFAPYKILECAGKKIAFVGVTTPETLTSSTPSYFKDEEGEYVYGFMQDKTGEALYAAIQGAVDAARGEGAEFVVVMAHLGNEEVLHPWIYSDVISNVRGIDVVLDGHSHDSDVVTMKNPDGEEVLRAACGTKLSSIGWCRIAADGKISIGLYNWNSDVPAPELLGIDNEMSRAVREANDALGEKLNEVVASTQVALTINDPVAVDSSGKPIRMVRRAETNLGDFCTDAFRAQSGADIAFFNGGGIRASIKAGDVTLRDLLSVNPFGNYLCVIEVTGQQILDALEWGARAVPDENGGFLQVSGLSYEIHVDVVSTCRSDENSAFVGVDGARRVQNVLVGGEPIDPNKTYTLAGHNYMLLEAGDGYSMFAGAPVLQNCVKLDNQVLIDYAVETLGGVIGEAYESPYGQGRIIIVE